MASTYSTNLALELIGTGDQTGTWGTTTNTNLGTLLEQAISGYVSQAITDGADTVITIPNGASGVARNMYIVCTGVLTAARNLVVPANNKLYFIYNATTGGFAVTVKVSGQTGVSVPNGKKLILVSNGTDVVDATNYLSSLTLGSALPVLSGGTGVTTSTGTGSVVLSTSPTLVTPALGTPVSGTLTNATGLPVATGISGLGTGVATFLATPSSANLAAALADETGTGSAVFATSPTLVTPILGTPTSGTLTNCTGYPTSALSGTVNLTTQVTGALPVANGGTGQSSALTQYGVAYASATTALATTSAGTTTTVLHGNAAGAPTFGAVSLTADVSGALPVANGGTGQTTASAAFNALSPITSTGDLIIGNGVNSSTRLPIGTSGYVLTSNGTTASWVTAGTATTASNIAGGAANQIVYQTGANASSFITAPSVSSTYLQWNGTSFTWATASSGSVTSVGVSGGTTGLTTSGGPITSSGTITLAGTLAVANGGTGGTTAAGARTNLGLAIGTDVPSPTGTGASGTWNIAISGNASTATTATNVSGTVAVANGGTGATTASAARTNLGLAIGTDVPSPTGTGASGSWGINITGSATSATTAGNVTGTVAIANGGTGQTTAGNAITALTGAQTSGYYLRSNGTNAVLASLAAADMTGTLAVANGGTGVGTSTGSGSNVLSTSPTLVTPILGTPTSVTLTNATGLPLTTGVTGTLPIANGGTGQTTAANAITALTGAQTSGYYLRSNGTAASLSTLQAADITGTVAVANGGTGLTTPGTSGNVLTSNGTTWVSQPAGYVTGQFRNLQLSANTIVNQQATVTTSGTGSVATITFATQSTAPFPSGTLVVITGVTPTGYNSVSATVISGTTSQITYSNSTTGVQSVAGTITTALTGNVAISFDEISLESSANLYVTARSGSLTPNIQAFGVNGLDTGSSAASTWYSVWVIYNPSTSTVAGLFSLSATSPTLPSGYTYYARVGWIRTDANKFPLGFKQFGRIASYVTTQAGNLLSLPFAASGAQGSSTIPTYVPVSISSYSPSTASRISVVVGTFTSNQATMVVPNNYYGAYNSTSNPPILMAYPYNSAGIVSGWLTLESSNLYYASSGGGTLQVYGWEDNL